MRTYRPVRTLTSAELLIRRAAESRHKRTQRQRRKVKVQEALAKGEPLPRSQDSFIRSKRFWRKSRWRLWQEVGRPQKGADDWRPKPPLYGNRRKPLLYGSRQPKALRNVKPLSSLLSDILFSCQPGVGRPNTSLSKENCSSGRTWERKRPGRPSFSELGKDEKWVLGPKGRSEQWLASDFWDRETYSLGERWNQTVLPLRK